MYVSVGNLQKNVIPCKPSMGKLVKVVKHIDVHGCIVCTLYVMYVSVRNLQESAVPCKLSMGKLVSVVNHVDVRMRNERN